ncbi:hypothetical protein R84981_001262 [Carnimonas sp. R-84981]|uniref:VENN motif pre-toxin domain-containing protein n=1 Tax=Carnimonas bestiolae TaxID=3402172 RepID=UPI003EDBFC14
MVDARVPNRGVGSDAQRLIQSATAVMQGLVSGDIGKGLANASESELNRLIHQATDQYKLGEQGNLALHAMLGAVIAEVNDNSALSVAAGATTAEALATEISKRYYHKSVAELTDDEKANLSSLTSLAAGLVGAATGDNASDAVRAAGSGKSAVENNSFGDIAEAIFQGKTTEQVAKEYIEDTNERYRKDNCAGMSLSACNTKMYQERREVLKKAGLASIDFIPVIGTIKDTYEAESAADYVEAAASLIPWGGPVAKGTIKAARHALKKGDVETASRLINEASEEVHVRWVDENASMSNRAREYNDSASGARSNIETRKGQAPTIDRIDDDGVKKPVRFDGVDGKVMVDRKISVLTTSKAKNQAVRQSKALRENGMTGTLGSS